MSLINHIPSINKIKFELPDEILNQTDISTIKEQTDCRYRQMSHTCLHEAIPIMKEWVVHNDFIMTTGSQMEGDSLVSTKTLPEAK